MFKVVALVILSFGDFVTVLHNSIQGDQELDSAKLEEEAESVIYHVNGKATTPSRTYFGYNHDDDETQNIADKFLDYIWTYPKYANKLDLMLKLMYIPRQQISTMKCTMENFSSL